MLEENMDLKKHIVCSCLEALVQNNLLSSWGWEMEEGVYKKSHCKSQRAQIPLSLPS